jgi:hypothetical protein
MKNLKENYDKSFAAVQAFMHKFSKSPLTIGQIYLDQAAGKSGHNISASEIRAELLPACRSKIDVRLRIFQMRGRTAYVNDGYKDTIKYFEQTLLTPIPNTNNRSWYLELGDEKIPATNFISPMDVLINGKYPSDGYTAEVFDSNKNIISTNYYTFDYYSGILTFTEDVTDEQINAFISDSNELYLTAFQYIGKTVSDVFTNLDEFANNIKKQLTADLTEKITEINTTLNEGLTALREYVNATNEFVEKVKAETIAIQHMNFTTSSPKFEPGAMYQLDEKFMLGPDGKPISVSDFVITLDGYCWEVICKDRNDVILTDISHELDEETNRWKSIITVQIAVNPENTERPTPIIGWNDTQPIYGELEFQATVFVRSNGTSIEVLETQYI